MLQDANLNKYIDAITNEAKAAKDAADEQIKQYKQDKLKSVRAQALFNSDNEIQRQCSVIHEDIGKSFSSDAIKIRKQIFEKRAEIKAAVFGKAAEKLLDFSKSDKYEAFLSRSITQVKAQLFGRDKLVKIFVKPDDMEYRSMIEKEMVFPCELHEDSTIKLGGIRVKFADLIIDDTLDTRLNEQVLWFEENSGLDIK